MYRKSMRSALEEARAYSAVNEVKVSKGGKTLSISKRDVGVYQAKGWSLQEADNFRGLMMDRLTKALKDKLSKEGGAAGFDDLKKTANKMGVVLTPANLKGMPGIKQHRDGDYILENKSSELINLYQIKNKTPEIEARIAKLEKELKVIKREETELEEALSLTVIKKEVQKIYDTAKKAGILGNTGHDNFKELLKQTDRKKLYRDMHKVGSSFGTVGKSNFSTPGMSGSMGDKIGKQLVDLSYKVNEEIVREARYRVDGQLSYKGIGSYDGFEMIINANSEKDAEDKAVKELDKARDKRKIGPGGGGSIDDIEFEGIERTNDPLEAPSTFRVSEFDPSKDLEEATPVPPRDLMLTYGKPGEKVKAYYTKFMQDLQNKAHELRKKGFVVDKMGLKQPMSKLRDTIPEETELVEFTLADYRELESDNQHDIAAKKLIDKFGTSQEKSTINDINRRHAKTGYISGTDFRLRTMIVNRYYSRLK